MNNETKDVKLTDEEYITKLENAIDDLNNYTNKLQQENQQLKEQVDYLKSGEYLNQVKWERDMLENVNQQLGEELKQRDEVIEECIESIQNFMTHIDDGFCADMMTFIDILNKYKGDNK